MNTRIVNNAQRLFQWRPTISVFCALVTILLSPAPALAKWPTLIFPSAEGITLARGSTYVIQWESLPGDPVNIYLCRDDPPDSTYCYDYIARDIPNSGSYSWTVPGNLPNGSDYMITVGVLGGAIAGSDYPFTISDSAPPTYVAVQGSVRTGDGIPVCALVLANGDYMFSCDGNGTFSLNVPLDDQGQVTLFAFADGFAPYRDTAVPGGLPPVVQTRTADPGSPLIAMTRGMACATNSWVRLSGAIESRGGDPLCALVLANGQHTFSCGASQGRYDLTVPADDNGNITLFGFADGFQPYRETFVALNCGLGLPSILGTYTGKGYATNQNCTDPYINISFSGTGRVEIYSQVGTSFEARTHTEILFEGDTYSGTDILHGTFASDGSIAGSIDGDFEATKHEGTFVGTIYGNTIDYDFQTHDTVGETCSTTGRVTASK